MGNIRKNILALGLVILVVEYTFVICDGIRWTKYHYNGNTGHEHVEPREKAFTAEVKDPVACAKLCHTNGVCKSFSYQAETDTCSGCRTLHCDAVATENPEDSATSVFFSTAKEPSALSSVRMVKRSDVEYIGTLEVFHNKQWTPVCADSFDTKKAMVVCNMLNFTWAVARSNSADAPKETTPIRLDDFSCTGSERSLSECPHYFVGESDCSLGRIAEIGCMPAWRVRLAGADDSSRRGRVEIADERKQWGSLCDTMFDENAAKVVCKMLGYQTSSSHYDVGAVDDEGAFVIDVLKCMGTEDSLQSCRYIAKESCDKKSVITVECL